MTLFEYLLTGSYIFTAIFGWRVLSILGSIDRRLEHQEGLMEGWNLDERVTALERKLGQGGSHA